jgi:hypothetical protein
MRRDLRRAVAAVLSVGAAAGLAACGGSEKPAAPATAPAPTVVTASVPASAAGELRRYRAEVGRVEGALNGWGAVLAMGQGGAPDARKLRGALQRFIGAIDRLAGQRFANAAVGARQSQLVAASRALSVVLATFTQDVAAGKLADATALGPQLNAGLANFAVAAAA